MPVTRFEELSVWQLARAFNRQVYKMTAERAFARDFAMIDQFRRASLSVMNNIAEGFERYRRNEFLQYLSTAKASAGEVRSMIYAASDVGYVSETTFKTMLAQVEQLGAAIGHFRSSLERSTPKVLPTRSRATARKN